MTGVMAASGSGLGVMAVDRMLHDSAATAPAITVMGISRRKLSVRVTILTMCGTARPRNDIGPQNAVVTAVMMPVVRSSDRLSLLTDMPRLSAYDVPNCMALSGLTRGMQHDMDMRMTSAYHGICPVVTSEKSPMPHTTYVCMPWAVALYVSRVMTDDMRYPVIIPAMRSMRLLRTAAAIASRSPVTAIAPHNALAITRA